MSVPECKGGPEVGVSWDEGLVLHSNDEDWHYWDESVYGPRPSRVPTTPGEIALHVIAHYADNDFEEGGLDKVRSLIVQAIEADRAQREPEEEPIYWEDADATALHALPYGDETAQIVDDAEGGVIAYSHRDNANEIVRALLAYRKEWS